MFDPAWKFWYRAQHERRCNASGEAFEKYVTAVLSLLHTDFINPDPMGTLGDGGCDGLADNGAILYACYGQRATTDIDRKTKDKLKADFARGCSSWPGFKTWRFVTNAPFGPNPAKALIALQTLHTPGTKRPVTLELWKAPDDLWRNAVNKLTASQLDEIMPGVPHAKNVELSDLVELIENLETIDGQDADHLEKIKPVPSTKMDFNQLPAITRAEFNEGRILSPRIDRWFTEQSVPELRDAKATSFRKIYQQARQTTNDVREIVRRIYVALGGQDFDSSTPRANAVYAVTVYFFDSCDIFEEPPADYVGEVKSNAATD
jgi:hypothetical protein